MLERCRSYFWALFLENGPTFDYRPIAIFETRRSSLLGLRCDNSVVQIKHQVRLGKPLVSWTGMFRYSTGPFGDCCQEIKHRCEHDEALRLNGLQIWLHFTLCFFPLDFLALAFLVDRGMPVYRIRMFLKSG